MKRLHAYGRHTSLKSIHGAPCSLLRPPRRSLAVFAVPSDDPRLKYARPEWLTPSAPSSPPGATPAGAAPAGAPQAAAAAPSGARVSIPQRAIGVDYGTVWTGLATGELGRGAPLRVLRNARSTAEICRELVAAAQDFGAGGIVVGIPLRQGQRAGDPSQDTPHAGRCRAFAETLSIVAGASGIDVFLYNEARTSAAAMVQADFSATDRLGNIGRTRKNDKQVDAWSAAMLLTRFFQNPGPAVRVKLRSVERGPLPPPPQPARPPAGGLKGKGPEQRRPRQEQQQQKQQQQQQQQARQPGAPGTPAAGAGGSLGLGGGALRPRPVRPRAQE